MKRLGRFLKAALKVTLGFFVWLFRAVFNLHSRLLYDVN